MPLPTHAAARLSLLQPAGCARLGSERLARWPTPVAQLLRQKKHSQEGGMRPGVTVELVAKLAGILARWVLLPAAKGKEQVDLKAGIAIMVGYLPHSLKWHALVQNGAVAVVVVDLVVVQVRSLRSPVHGRMAEKKLLLANETKLTSGNLKSTRVSEQKFAETELTDL